MLPLDVTPVPAISVFPLASVGSRERLSIASDALLSLVGVQLAPPFVLTQIPPPGVPT